MSGTSTVSLSFGELHFLELLGEDRLHAKRDVGVLGGVGGDLRDGDFVHSLLVAAFADELVDLDRRVVEVSVGRGRRGCGCGRRHRAGNWRSSCRTPSRQA